MDNRFRVSVPELNERLHSDGDQKVVDGVDVEEGILRTSIDDSESAGEELIKG